MSFHSPAPHVPTAAEQTRADGWSPARQRRFVETLAATGIVRLACEACRITPRSAYNLRIRRDGAAFRLGWDAAILIARARLADDLLARAITGSEEVIRKDDDNREIVRHRHDNRLAMSMLARLDRMADCPPEGSDAALARVVAQDFAAYCDLFCPQDEALAEGEREGLPCPGAEPSARLMEDARLLDGSMPDLPPPEPDCAAAILSPGASAALFVAARMALARAEPPPLHPLQGRCELPAPVDLMTLPPEDAADRLRGLWWDDEQQGWRTDYPPPPGFDGEESAPDYVIDEYERGLTEAEEAAVLARQQAEHAPYLAAAARARDMFFDALAKAPARDEPVP
ncbi:hypothetical protein WG907_10715 [Sphingobium sp. AN558]|uniref:hypothetical protein n=1 Tax=Sphingobium sp. AN558 TaxID=3133442 RepID=UPI0030C2CB1C